LSIARLLSQKITFVAEPLGGAAPDVADGDAGLAQVADRRPGIGDAKRAHEVDRRAAGPLSEGVVEAELMGREGPFAAFVADGPGGSREAGSGEAGSGAPRRGVSGGRSGNGFADLLGDYRPQLGRGGDNDEMVAHHGGFERV